MPTEPLNTEQQFVRDLFALAKERPVSLRDFITELYPAGKGTFRGPCPFCQAGEDRFVLWPEQEPQFGGRYYCNRCEKRGNGIHYLREKLGWGFNLAQDLFNTNLNQAEAGSFSFAPTPLRQADQTMPLELGETYPQSLRDIIAPEPLTGEAKLMEEFLEIQADISETQIGYQATVRMPDLYTDTEKDYWEARLAKLYAKRDSLELQLTQDAFWDQPIK